MIVEDVNQSYFSLRKANWAHFRPGFKGTARRLCLPDAVLLAVLNRELANAEEIPIKVALT